MAVEQQRLRYVLRSEPRTLRKASTSIKVILLCQSALRDEIERDKLVFLYMVYYELRGIYTFVVIFSVSLNVKLHVHFFHRLNSHASKADGTPGLHKQKNTLIEKVFVRCGKKTGKSNIFCDFYIKKKREVEPRIIIGKSLPYCKIAGATFFIILICLPAKRTVT